MPNLWSKRRPGGGELPLSVSRGGLTDKLEQNGKSQGCARGGGGGVTLRHRSQEPGFICNRIVFDAVTPSVYTTRIETFGETGLI